MSPDFNSPNSAAVVPADIDVGVLLSDQTMQCRAILKHSILNKHQATLLPMPHQLDAMQIAAHHNKPARAKTRARTS
jgi:hypothetical protein